MPGTKPRTITVGAVQRAFIGDRDRDIADTAAMVREAAARGAQVILPSELYEGHYFCTAQDEGVFASARPVDEHPAVEAMREVARAERVYVPASFFERDGHHYYNSIAMVDDEGRVMGVYRKSHIPDGPGYMEKFYFRPGNTGFKVWRTRHGAVGVGICWDQWYPETARAMMLMGAEVLMFPTAIGEEPHDPSLDTRRLWRRAMVGHAVSNVVPIVAANRIGTETSAAGRPVGEHGVEGGDQAYYGHSFIADHRGDMVAEAGQEPGVLTATFDLDTIARHRAAFGFFRDRRPNLYGRIAEDV